MRLLLKHILQSAEDSAQIALQLHYARAEVYYDHPVSPEQAMRRRRLIGLLHQRIEMLSTRRLLRSLTGVYLN